MLAVVFFCPAGARRVRIESSKRIAVTSSFFFPRSGGAGWKQALSTRAGIHERMVSRSVPFTHYLLLVVASLVSPAQ